MLGPLRVVAAGREVPLPSRRQRALLVLFAMNANTTVSADRLADQLWDGEPPPSALLTLRSYISQIRKALDEHVVGRIRITTTDSGYRLDVDEDDVDVVRFRRLVAAGHRHLRSAESLGAIEAFDAALEMWRGEPLLEIADHEAAHALLGELAELRTSAVEGRLRALVDAGRHVEAVSGLELLVTTEPLREGPHELLMVSLYRSGRSAEALEVHRRFRTVLQDQLGIDPSPRLQQLMTAILNRDPRLDALPDESASGAAADLPPTDLVLMLIDTLHAVGEQLAAVVETLGDQLPIDLAVLAEAAARIGPRAPQATGAGIAS